jgi:hypothetical protein
MGIACRLINPSSSKQGVLDKWLIDLTGNIAISRSGLALLARIETLHVPVFVSTEQAIEWGSHLNTEQRATLADIQRTASNAALGEGNLQRMVNLATQSQLLREAAEAAPMDCHIRHSLS